MPFSENVEEEVKNSASHSTILNENHCGPSDFLVPFPSHTWEENPGSYFEAGFGINFLSMPGKEI